MRQGSCMGNAIEEVKQAADAITDSNDNDGAAKYLEKYILEKMNYLSKNCTDSHIALFFANAVHQIQGSGRQLFELAANDNFTRRIPVNHGRKTPLFCRQQGYDFLFLFSGIWYNIFYVR